MITPMDRFILNMRNECLQGIPGPTEPRTLASQDADYIVCAVDVYMTERCARQEGVSILTSPEHRIDRFRKNLATLHLTSTFYEIQAIDEDRDTESSGDLDGIADNLIQLNDEGKAHSYNTERRSTIEGGDEHGYVYRALTNRERTSLERKVKERLGDTYLK